MIFYTTKLNKIVKKLILTIEKKSLTISTAESCTGGLIAKVITDFPGVSSIYKGSIVAYSNEVKIKQLNVDENIIKENGVVSENVVAKMAGNLKNIFNTDLAISVSGIAGPDGGSIEKPVGTVCFGFAIDKKIITATKKFTGNRKKIRIKSVIFALRKMQILLTEK